MENYNPKEIESKWQKIWREGGINRTENNSDKPKYYILDMFPYPSGTGLHMGHTESYTSTDILYRYKKMKGFDVLHPQGFDAFGLPAENFAIKTGVHPKETTVKNIANYEKQIDSLGMGYDWDTKIVTASPEYYKWTQWIFARFFENDLVYKKTDKINWCDSCKTGLANEQVVDGGCERCKNKVVQKEIPGWFFKITDFAEDLINDLDKVDWPEHTKVNQKNWIGRSEGSEIDFKIKNSELKIKVFTTRADTLFGVTYMVIAPEHKIIQELKSNIENWGEVENYIIETQKKTEMDRVGSNEKTGFELKGIKAINPANQEEIPVFTADYVLANYGTGAIMAVPAHDQRDFEFALKNNLEIKPVIARVNSVEEIFPGLTEAIIKSIRESGFATFGSGLLINSGRFNGMSSEEAKKAITEFVGGETKTNYRLRDWSISRQRYWGAPIPVVYDLEGKAHIVPDEHLPWKLPEDVDFVPTGESPLKKSKEFFERTEKIFGKGWTPEVDTMDTFVCSSWYYLRYPDSKNGKEFCSKEMMEKWLPVDLYIGGAEHTYMHLLYARFMTKALRKIGVLDFDEPFLKLRHQGMVLDKNGGKMSKSKGNVINPDDMVARFGADAVRMYMMFLGPLEDEVKWNEDNIVGIYRFLERVWKSINDNIELSYSAISLKKLISNLNIEFVLNKTIKEVGEDIENFKFNTAISKLMVLFNKTGRLPLLNFFKNPDFYELISRNDTEKLIILLAPFAPHIAEELWSGLSEISNDEKYKQSIFLQKWPEYDESKIKENTFNLVIQVNGKVRANVEASVDISQEEAERLALGLGEIKKWIEGKEIKKIIFVKGKLVNLVV